MFKLVPKATNIGKYCSPQRCSIAGQVLLCMNLTESVFSKSADESWQISFRFHQSLWQFPPQCVLNQFLFYQRHHPLSHICWQNCRCQQKHRSTMLNVWYPRLIITIMRLPLMRSPSVSQKKTKQNKTEQNLQWQPEKLHGNIRKKKKAQWWD